MVRPLHPDRVRTSALDFWFARSAIACVAGLQMIIENDCSLGTRWHNPTLELALLAQLSAATAWNEVRA